MNRAAWFVPGRIEVFGKHTDYGGGRSLLAATGQGLTFVGERAPRLTVQSDVPGGHYADSVRRGLAARFGVEGGAHVRVTSTLPAAAGLGSSSAFVTGLVLVLADLWEVPLPAGPARADLIAEVERGVGVAGGAEDHAAVLLATGGHLLPCRFLPTRPEPAVPWPDTHVFVVAVSGVRAEKALGTKERYNRTAGVLAALRARGIPLGELVEDPSALPAHAAGLDLASARRLNQFVVESAELIPAAAAAVAGRDWAALGVLADRSHVLGREALDNAVPETEALAARARALGAVAASPFGAGFGGSVWAVVPREDATRFATRWHEVTLITSPGAGARRLEVAP